MTDSQKAEIAKLRNLGLGYKVIAKKMNIPVVNIKGYRQQSNDAKRCPDKNFNERKTSTATSKLTFTEAKMDNQIKSALLRKKMHQKGLITDFRT